MFKYHLSFYCAPLVFKMAFLSTTVSVLWPLVTQIWDLHNTFAFAGELTVLRRLWRPPSANISKPFYQYFQQLVLLNFPCHLCFQIGTHSIFHQPDSVCCVSMHLFLLWSALPYIPSRNMIWRLSSILQLTYLITTGFDSNGWNVDLERVLTVKFH